MSLGLLAKDSIQDLEALGRGETDEERSGGSGSKLPHAPIPGGVASVALPDDVSSTRGGGESRGRVAGGDQPQQQQAQAQAGGYANPQQAQDDDSYAEAETAAAAATAPAPPPPRGSAGAYAGFRSDYHYQHNDPHLHGQYTNITAAVDPNNYFETPVLEYLAEKKPDSKPRGLLDCIFPCIFGNSTSKRLENEEIHHPYPSPDLQSQYYREQPTSVASSSSSASPTRSSNLGRAHSRDEDEISTNSDMLGEKLSDKERQAVLARLGLAQPDNDNDSSTKKRKVGAAADRQQQEDQKLQNDSDGGGSGSRQPQQQEEALLKDESARSHSSNQDVPPSAPTGTSDSSSVKNHHHHPKGGLLNGIPTYDASPLLAACEEEEERKRKPRKSILKRRSTINNSSNTLGDSSQQVRGGGSVGGSVGSKDGGVSRRSLFPSYSAPVVKKHTNNHVSFAPMARVVTVKSKNDMEHQEKADVWWQKPDYEDFRRTGRIITKAMLEGGTEIWLQESCSNDKDGNNNKASSSSSSAAAKNTSDGYAPGDKWWHRFGHSRRGLEHVVSIDEGRERQQNVRNAIHSVLEEQLRQKRYKREDPEKLRIVSLNHTSWARDLSLASGASDADAVTSSFSTERKSREFYLLKLARKSPAAASASARRVPDFMQPAMKVTKASVTTSTAGPMMKTLKLDANTAAQIQFRRDQTKDALQQKQQQQENQQQIQKDEISGVISENTEPIHDPPPVVEVGTSPKKDHQPSMAERAKGFISLEEGDNNVDMAAVLSGMGALPHEPPMPVSLSSSL